MKLNPINWLLDDEAGTRSSPCPGGGDAAHRTGERTLLGVENLLQLRRVSPNPSP